MADQPPTGRRFTHVYLERGAPVSDSQRMRRRTGSLAHQLFGIGFSRYLEQELGVQVSTDLTRFFVSAEIHDVLDAITLLNTASSPPKSITWLQECRRIFEEESCGYRLDEEGGVHPVVDQQFVHEQSATIRALNLARYASARADFEAAFSALDSTNPDTIRAIRGVFDACETVFKLGFPGQSRLGSSEVERTLKPIVQRLYSGVEWNCANQLLNAFSAWINAAHQYRHAQAHQEPKAPPISLTVMLLSLGASYLRWLVEIDQALASPSS